MMDLRGPVFEQEVVHGIVAAAKVGDKTLSQQELRNMVEDEEKMASA